MNQVDEKRVRETIYYILENMEKEINRSVTSTSRYSAKVEATDMIMVLFRKKGQSIWNVKIVDMKSGGIQLTKDIIIMC